jgi:hypothetical protein
MSTLEHPRPDGLLHTPAFSQVVAATGTRTIYTGKSPSTSAARLSVPVTSSRRQHRSCVMSAWRSPPPVRPTPTS